MPIVECTFSLDEAILSFAFRSAYGWIFAVVLVGAGVLRLYEPDMSGTVAAGVMGMTVLAGMVILFQAVSTWNDCRDATAPASASSRTSRASRFATACPGSNSPDSPESPFARAPATFSRRQTVPRPGFRLDRSVCVGTHAHLHCPPLDR